MLLSDRFFVICSAFCFEGCLTELLTTSSVLVFGSAPYHVKTHVFTYRFQAGTVVRATAIGTSAGPPPRRSTAVPRRSVAAPAPGMEACTSILMW